MSNNRNGEFNLYTSIDPVIKEYFPDLIQAVHVALAMFGTMSIEGRNAPLALIFEGASGKGKSTVLRMCMPDEKDEDFKKYVYRSDKFSPKSFVSHATNINGKKLAEMDLLPKLENKMLISKELAPIFRGREEEMKENFSTLISVLDGDGFTSDTGARGQRGYERRIVFNWMGATTPLPASTHRLMSQLGTRLMFYEIDLEMPGEDELISELESDDSLYHQSICSQAVRDFLIAYFARYPVDSVPLGKFSMPREFMRTVARWTKFLCFIRTEPKREKIKGSQWEVVGKEKTEGPHRVLNFFRLLAIGHALMCGRMEVQAEDAEILESVGMGSVPGHLRSLIRAMRRSGGRISTEEAAEACETTEMTARGYMRELKYLEVAYFVSEKPALLAFQRDFNWLIHK